MLPSLNRKSERLSDLEGEAKLQQAELKLLPPPGAVLLPQFLATAHEVPSPLASEKHRLCRLPLGPDVDIWTPRSECLIFRTKCLICQILNENVGSTLLAMWQCVKMMRCFPVELI